MANGTLLYSQSGGVTAVINATASGVIAEARARKVKVLAARNGILGALREELVDTSKETAAAVRGLAHTPGGAFGSCRVKLKSLEEDRARYERLLGYMHEHNLTPAGPSREIALIDDIISDDPATYVTQITVPVTVLD